ncbi:hypothetical protein TNCV_967221 [Trichonephila clavipes]|nr:hypothetical protein TNCV_967221 [Trichonephila clavipes]
MLEPSAAENSPCRGSQFMLNRLKLKCPPVGAVWKLEGEMCHFTHRCHPRLLKKFKISGSVTNIPRAALLCNINLTLSLGVIEDFQVERLMHINFVEAQSSYVTVVWKFGSTVLPVQVSPITGILHVTLKYTINRKTIDFFSFQEF